jgi:hypothetical protein
MGGTNNFLFYDSLSGKFSWSNSYIWATGPQYLMKHSASSEGLYYNNAQLAYLNDAGLPVFSANWSTGNGYFYNHLGIGTTTPQFPLSLPPMVGDKISLYGDAGPHYGFGIQPYLMQIHTDDAPSDIAFGYGSSASFTETMRIKGNGNVGIGTTAPLAKLHVADGAVVFAANGDITVTPGDPPTIGAGRRTMWYPDKAAFRAGYTGGIDWDKNNVGNYSVAMGSSTRAVGIASVALGNGTRTDGNYATAMGGFTRAGGDYSVALGNSTDAAGVGSFAMGNFSGANNSYSVAFGSNVNANGPYSFAVGSFATAGGDYSVAMGIEVTASGLSSL